MVEDQEKEDSLFDQSLSRNIHSDFREKKKRHKRENYEYYNINTKRIVIWIYKITKLLTCKELKTPMVQFSKREKKEHHKLYTKGYFDLFFVSIK